MRLVDGAAEQIRVYDQAREFDAKTREALTKVLQLQQYGLDVVVILVADISDGADVILADEDSRLGGRLISNGETIDGAPGLEWVAAAEAELAALLGHEIGHVNARHSAQRSGQGLLANVALIGVALTANERWGNLAIVGGQIGASALLASYSRDNEREADALGQAYMVRGGYPANGMVRLHQLLLDGEKQTPSLLQTMFSSHPMSTERVATAERLARTQYANTSGLPTQRERFMDSTASVRRIKPTIEACQRGETAMAIYKKLHRIRQALLDCVRREIFNHESL